jgi:photosystem II stability/assembly factor-like uncharacterized protein
MATMTANLSTNGGTVAYGAAPALAMNVATLGGLVRLERERPGAPWREMRRTLEDRHVSALTFAADRLFAASHQRGIVVSDDDGKTWQSASSGIAETNVFTLAAQTRGETTVLFAGVEPAKLYRSDDLGASWRELPALRDVPRTELWTFPPPPHIAHVKNIAFHPSDPATLYVCIEQGALLKSDDDGATWRELDTYEDTAEDKFRHDCHRVLIARNDPNRLWLMTGDGSYRSDDAGATWDRLTTRDDTIGYPDAAFVDPNDDQILYLGGPRNAPRAWGTGRFADATVLRSVDGGESWHDRRTGLPSRIVGNIEAMGMHAGPTHVMLIAGTATGEVFASDDAGANWSEAARNLPPISKGGHYRWFVDDARRAEIEERMRAQAAVV